MSRISLLPFDLQRLLCRYLQGIEKKPGKSLLKYFAGSSLFALFDTFWKMHTHCKSYPLQYLVSTNNLAALEHADKYRSKEGIIAIYDPDISLEIYKKFGTRSWLRSPNSLALVHAGNIRVFAEVGKESKYHTFYDQAFCHAVSIRKFELLKAAPLPCNKLLAPPLTPNYTPEDAEQLLEIMLSKTNPRIIAEAYLERIPLIAIGLVMRGYEFSHQELHDLLRSPDEVFEFIMSLDYSFRDCCALSCGHSLQLFTRIYRELPRLDYMSMLTSKYMSNEVVQFVIADKKVSGAQIVELCATSVEASLNILPFVSLNAEELIHALMLRVDREDFVTRFKALSTPQRELCLRLMPLEDFEFLLEPHCIETGTTVSTFFPK